MRSTPALTRRFSVARGVRHVWPRLFPPGRRARGGCVQGAPAGSVHGVPLSASSAQSAARVFIVVLAFKVVQYGMVCLYYVVRILDARTGRCLA